MQNYILLTKFTQSRYFIFSNKNYKIKPFFTYKNYPVSRPIFEQRDQDYNGSRPRPVQNSRDQDRDRDHKILVSRPVSRPTALTLTKTFQELLDEEWIASVNELSTGQPTWYLPFFVTKQDKPRVVYDGAAKVGGTCLNQAVLAGPNLLNNLMEVLARFRLGKFACIADLSKCFFSNCNARRAKGLV